MSNLAVDLAGWRVAMMMMMMVLVGAWSVPEGDRRRGAQEKR
jgi:hypothetical protein